MSGAVQEGGLRVKLHAQLLRIQCVYIVVSALLVLVSRALSHPSKHMLLKIPQTRSLSKCFWECFLIRYLGLLSAAFRVLFDKYIGADRLNTLARILILTYFFNHA